MLSRFLLDDTGQDIIEYALLGAFLGVVGLLAWNSIGVSIGSKYLGWDSGVQGLSDPPDPGAGS